VPWDFDRFGYVKRCFAGLSFEDVNQFLAVIEGILKGIEN
jgi:hypothetical protein